MKLADHLTRDDLQEVEDVAGKLEALIVQHRQSGHVPIDSLRFLDWRLHRLASVQRNLPMARDSSGERD